MRIGVTGQEPAVDELLTGRQNLDMFGRLFHLDGAARRRRADELLEQFNLRDAASKKVKHYSGGMRRRLDLAVGFIMNPRVLFLDEPTTGLDPRHRYEVWDVVRSLVAGGTTVLLTTHYLDEADQLADSISVIDHGRVIAEGPPDALKAQIGGSQVDLVLARRGRAAGGGRDPAAGRGRGAGAGRGGAAADRAARRAGGRARPSCCASSSTRRSPPRTSRCGGRRSTRCSCG